jgi:hypothetical protein
LATTKTSGRVIRRYVVASSSANKGSPSEVVSFLVAAIGVDTDLHLSILVRRRILRAYFSCVGASPVERVDICNPRKTFNELGK